MKQDKEMHAKRTKLSSQRSKFLLEKEEHTKVVRDMVTKIRRESEKRNNESEKREEEERKEKVQEESWRQERQEKLQSVEKEIEIYGTQNNLNASRVLIIEREKMIKEHKAWEKKREEFWEHRLRENEEKREQEEARLGKLIKEYEREIQRYEKKQREDEVRRQQEEQQLNDIQENHRKQLQEMRRQYEEEVRKQAEECNDFRCRYAKDIQAEKEKYGRRMEDLKQKQQQQTNSMIQQLKRNRMFERDFGKLKERQEREVSELRMIECDHNRGQLNTVISELQKKHDEEINEWIQARISVATREKKCSIS